MRARVHTAHTHPHHKRTIKWQCIKPMAKNAQLCNCVSHKMVQLECDTPPAARHATFLCCIAARLSIKRSRSNQGRLAPQMRRRGTDLADWLLGSGWYVQY